MDSLRCLTCTSSTAMSQIGASNSRRTSVATCTKATSKGFHPPKPSMIADVPQWSQAAVCDLASTTAARNTGLQTIAANLTEKSSEERARNLINLNCTSGSVPISPRRQPMPEWLVEQIEEIGQVAKSWVQEQKEELQMIVRKGRAAYELVMTELIIDRLFIPADERSNLVQGNYCPVAEIGDKVPVHVINGEIPKDFPPGCYIRNGPNPIHGGHQNLDSPFGGKTLYCWFEGEGMLHATYFAEDGSIWYKNKYVKTESFVKEEKTGRRMYLPTMDEQSTPGVRFNRMINNCIFGTPQRNSGNTSVFEHAGHVVAAVEGGAAYEIDISDLSTLGEYTCDGQWNRRFFGPHPKILPDTQEMVVYGFDIVKPYYLFSLISSDGKKMLQQIDACMDRLVLMHDIGVTERHIIVYDFPLIMDIYKMLMKGEPIVSAEPRSYSRIGVITIKGEPDSIKWFDVDPAFISHHCNSYQEGDEIVLHAVVTRLIQILAVPQGMDKLDWYTKGMTLNNHDEYETGDSCINGKLFEHLHEWRLNLKTGAVVEKDITQRKFPMELPKINEEYTGKKYRYCYACSEDIAASCAVGYPTFGKLVKVDVTYKQPPQFHDVGDETYTSEPTFVARPGTTEEDDGWIVAYVHNESTDLSDMIIIDAKKFEEEPVARIRLPQRVPYGFHGNYIRSR